MTNNDDETRETFDFFSNEYSQALQAFEAIERQSGTLMVMGSADELRGFVEQFITMATRTRDLARERDETNFADWFTELIHRAETLRQQISTIA